MRQPLWCLLRLLGEMCVAETSGRVADLRQWSRAQLLAEMRVADLRQWSRAQPLAEMRVATMRVADILGLSCTWLRCAEHAGGSVTALGGCVVGNFMLWIFGSGHLTGLYRFQGSATSLEIQGLSMFRG